jgi:hypothetical protein|tara:strand:+ start:90 stop:326 length:237 start_codon:yes stop_codon:yes gene_type:complete
MSFFKGWPTLTEIFFGKEKKKAVKKVAPKIATKPKKTTKKELSKLTKVQLEELGRQKGIELDRRLSKDKLVAQLHKKL